MGRRVHEVAKELGIKSKELLDKLEKAGISVKNHMSTLTEDEISKIKGNKSNQKEEKETGKQKKKFFGKPIVDKDYLENKGKSVKKEDSPLQSKEEKEENSKSEESSKNQTSLQDEKKSKSKEKVEKQKAEVSTSKKENSINKKDNLDSKKENAPEQSKEEPKTSGRRVLKIVKKAKVQEAEDKARVEESAKKDRLIREKREKEAKERKASKGQRDKKQGNSSNSNKDGKDERTRRTNKDKQKSGNKKSFSKDKDSRDTKDQSKGKNNSSRFDSKNKERSNSAPIQSEGKKEFSKTRDKKKHKDSKKEHSKFDKLERRSLEKQARKKYNKPKAQVEAVEIEEEVLPEGTIVINVPITVAGLCEQAGISTPTVIMALMKMGIMANINQTIDEDTVMILGEELGLKLVIGSVEKEEEEIGIETFEDKEEDLKERPPIITVMGHVDHGKTSLLDAIRKTNVTASESGGITQHIGASEVNVDGQKIVFLDTPGHEAFTAMRARGAHVTDIAVLVVAADDSVKPQTIESISHAKAAGVPIIVAINKMDKPGATPDMVKKDLADHGILVEDWGGDVISVPVSAKTGDGIMNLLEMILLQAEVLELKANPNRLAQGSVIEARLDKAKGPVATLLVTNGTLRSGDSLVAGTCSGRIRLMTDFRGKTIKKAGPATAVEILGLTEVPQAGDEFNAVKEDKLAREIAESRKEKLREEILAKNASSTLEQLFSQIKEGEVKNLNLVIKGDVQGSVGALVASLEKLNNENVKVNIIHTGVGTVTESDVMLAGTSGAIIIAFNVRPSTAVQTMADRDNIQIRTYRVIYDVIDDIENAMKGLLDPEFKEEILGKAEIRNTFKVPNVGIIGGAYVIEGKIQRNAEVRLVRDGAIIHEGKISSLKRFKDDAKEVKQGFECGIGIEGYNDIKDGDLIECFHMIEIER